MKRIQAQKEMARMASSTLEIDVPKVGNPDESGGWMDWKK